MIEGITDTVVSYVETIGIFELAGKISATIISQFPTIVLALFNIILAVVTIRMIMKVL